MRIIFIIFAIATAIIFAPYAFADDNQTQTLVENANQSISAGDFNTACTNLDQALKIDPDDVDILYALAINAERCGRSDAIEKLEHLLSLDPNADEARLQLALIQSRLGNSDKANQALDYVLTRHPDLPAAIAIQWQIQAGVAIEPSAWQLNGRLDLAFGYDSNLGLTSTVLPQASQQSVGLALIDLAFGAHYRGHNRPYVAFVRFTSIQPFNDRDISTNSAATVIGFGALGRKYFQDIETVLDLRYDEVFTNSFSKHRERIIAPSLTFAKSINALQRLRVLAGFDYHDVIASPQALDKSAAIEPDNLVARLGLRDTLSIDNWSVTVDAAYRHSFPQATVAVGGISRNVDFSEFSGQLYGEMRLTPMLSALAQTGLATRSFTDNARPRELTWQAQAGLRASFEFIELHAEYAYFRNDSKTDAFTWDKHSFFAGVRVYTL
ncbi:MAG: tetratricopeptide repeat protein [Deltaproteobacteria bacterium]|nr:tetratricopeptide repeat protein [Deltaproteobacteria bacterium]